MSARSRVEEIDRNIAAIRVSGFRCRGVSPTDSDLSAVPPSNLDERSAEQTRGKRKRKLQSPDDEGDIEARQRGARSVKRSEVNDEVKKQNAPVGKKGNNRGSFQQSKDAAEKEVSTSTLMDAHQISRWGKHPSTASSGAVTRKLLGTSNGRPATMRLFLGTRKPHSTHQTATPAATEGNITTTACESKKTKSSKGTASLIASLNMDHMAHSSSFAVSNVKPHDITSTTSTPGHQVPSAAIAFDAPCKARKPPRVPNNVKPASAKQSTIRNPNDYQIRSTAPAGYPSSRFCKILRLVADLQHPRLEAARSRLPTPSTRPPVWAAVHPHFILARTSADNTPVCAVSTRAM